MDKIPIISDRTPQPIGPYVHAVLHDFTYHLEVSGQSGRDPHTGQLSEGIEAQTEQTLNNIETILSGVGWGLDSVIKMRVYLRDIADYSRVNDIYERKLGNNVPSRVVVGVQGLPGNALIEMECSAGGHQIPDRYREHAKK